MSVETAEVEAERLLDRMWRSKTGELLLPVDPIVIAKRLGLHVFEGRLNSDVSALIQKEVGEDARIILNERDSVVRRRFSCAHELGHYIQKDTEDGAFAWTDYRGPLSEQGLDSQEIFANQFAAALLMPASEVRSRYDQGGRVADLAATFNVSIDAMQFRLANLQLKPTG